MIEDYIDKTFFGDCLEIMPQLPDGCFDMICADLPYEITSCSWDSLIPFDKLWPQYLRLIKPNGAIVLTSSQPFTSALIMSNPTMFRYEYIWVKTKASGFQNAKRLPMKKHESVLVFYSKQPTYNQQNLRKLDKPIKSGRERKTNEHKLGVAGKPDYHTEFTGYQDSLLCFPNPSGKGHLHPTQKPVPLMEYLINIYTNRGGVVLDNCAGSGTTGVACKNTGRHYVMIEKERVHYDNILKRLAIDSEPCESSELKPAIATQEQMNLFK